MKLDGDFVFEASVQEVWDALFDPAVLAAALPGCEKLELVDGSYLGELKVKIGPIQGKFSGKVDLLDQVEPRSYRMLVDGRGAQGFVKANATIDLEAAGAGTKLRYQSEAQVGGKIASVGQRLIETSARAIVKQSLEGLGENIALRAAAYRNQKAASTTATALVPPPGSNLEGEPDRSAAITEPPPATEVAPHPHVTPVEASHASSSADAPAIAAAQPIQPVAPVIEYKRAEVSKLASTVAKEVGKSLAPTIALAFIAVAIIVYLLAR